MSNLGILKLEYKDGEGNYQQFSQTGLFISHPEDVIAAWPTNETITGNVYEQATFIDGISTLFRTLTGIIPSSTPPNKASQMKILFPNLVYGPTLSYDVPPPDIKVEGVAFENIVATARGGNIIAFKRTGIPGISSSVPSSAFASRISGDGLSIYFWPDNYLKNGKLNITDYLTDKDGGIYGPLYGVRMYIYYKANGEISGIQYTSSTGTPIGFNYGNEYWGMTKEYFDSLISMDIPSFNSQDPYEENGTSGGGGGGGSFDRTSDPISHPSLPTIQLGNLGLFTMYNPSVVQLQNFGSFLWSDGFSIDDLKKIFADPSQAIIGMQLLPVHLSSGAVKNVTIGNIDTGVSMTSLSSQWASHDCGSITIPEFWGSYLDYQPYTQIQLYLPYIGVVTVGANDLLTHAGKTLNLQYNVDALSGACVATLKCGDSVLYHWQGNCGLQIPYTSLTYGNLLNAMMGVVSGGVQALAGNPLGGLGSAVTSGLNALAPDIKKGGTLSSAGGLMDIQVPYLIITRPNLCLPENQNTYIGYPSWVTVTLSELSGYTKVEDIHLTNIPATDPELVEIENLLKSGVIM